jgi:microcystin-dependent protein
MFAGNFAPAGWMFCQGQLLAISEYETLFNLIGTTYGGDGQDTFALPDLQGRVPVHQGSGFTLAETGGVESVTLTVSQIPAHLHALQASSGNAGTTNPSNKVLASPTSIDLYRPATTPSSPLAVPQAVGSTGGSQPHDNMQPYLCVSYIISLFGIFPSQT